MCDCTFILFKPNVFFNFEYSGEFRIGFTIVSSTEIPVEADDRGNNMWRGGFLKKCQLIPLVFNNYLLLFY